MKNIFKVGDKIRVLDTAVNRADPEFGCTLSTGILTVGKVIDDHIIPKEDEFALLHHDRFELAEPVEGSAEWAWQMMEQGKWVFNINYLSDHHMTIKDDEVVCDYCKNHRLSIERWKRYWDDQPTGWQLYKEWAWQMMEQGKWVRNNQNSAGFHIENGIAVLMGVRWTRDEFLKCAQSDGWQIYTPTKFANVKAGDWVEFSNGVVAKCISSDALDDEKGYFETTSASSNGYGYILWRKSDGTNFTYSKEEIHALSIIPSSEVKISIKLKPMRIEKAYLDDDLVYADDEGCISKNNIENIDEVEALLKAQEEK